MIQRMKFMKLTSSNALRADLLRDVFEGLGNLALILSTHPLVTVENTSMLSGLPAALLLFIRP